MRISEVNSCRCAGTHPAGDRQARKIHRRPQFHRQREERLGELLQLLQARAGVARELAQRLQVEFAAYLVGSIHPLLAVLREGLARFGMICEPIGRSRRRDRIEMIGRIKRPLQLRW